MRKLFTLLLAGFLLISCVEQSPVRIHILGDSTTEQQNQNLKDQRGWPQLLAPFFNDQVTILNHGKSGTSTRTYYEGQWWENAKETILPGDFVVIQFGHNDEKHDGYDGPIGTLASGSYRDYLRKFVDEVRQLGATPILVTPIVRKMSRAGENVSRRAAHDLAEHITRNIDPTVDPADTVTFNYPHNMKAVAAERECLLIDMTASTKAYIDSIGFETATRRIYNFGDGTHICAEGALLFSRLFVLEMKRKGILTDYIVENPEGVMQPCAVDFGEIFCGGEYRQEIDLMKLRAESGFSAFRVEANEGVTVSGREYDEYSQQVDLQASYDLIYYRPLYLRINPAVEGEFSSGVWVRIGTDNHYIPIKATVRTYPQGEPVTVRYTLSGNSKPETKGPVTALEHTLSGLKRIGFDQLGENGIGSHLDPPITFRAEWLDVSEDRWPEQEMDVVWDRYAQFGFSAVPGSTFYLEKITIHAGGGVRYRIMVSKDPQFTRYQVVGEGAGEKLTRFEIPYTETVGGAETFYLRIYPWYDPVENGRLCLSHITFEGKVK